jgi:tetratricopeptide (TPR) repeat protein
MPATGGQLRLMRCNTAQMNSWHSWSPNSRWLVFSSKNRGPYTQLYLTHIDENGDDSPPVFLENLISQKRAANIPEFFPTNHTEFRKIVDEFSQNAVYYNRLAVLAITDDEFKNALNNIELAIQADSTYVDAYVNRILINQKLGRSLSKADLVDRAIAQRLIEKQMRNKPADKLLLYQRGNFRLLLDDDDGAIQDGLELIRSNTEVYKAYDLVTSGYQKLGQVEKAIPYFKEMLTLWPGNKQIEYDLALAYQAAQQFAPALTLLNELVGRYPDESGLYISRAILLSLHGAQEAAKADFNKAIAVDASNYKAYYQRGLYSLHHSSPEAAKVDFDKAVSLLTDEIDKNPQNAPLLLKKAEILEQSGNGREALTEYEAYTQVWGMSKIALNRIALIYYAQKEWQAAIDAYTAMINHFAGEAGFFYARSLAWQQTADFSRALQDADQAVALAPADYNCLYHRARIKYELRDELGYKGDLKASADVLHNLQKERPLSQKENEMLGSIGRLLKD